MVRGSGTLLLVKMGDREDGEMEMGVGRGCFVDGGSEREFITELDGWCDSHD